ncbi:MAG: hypothetical protein HBSAPP04_19770 [Ignavibacteriaceae bacterium]|nr:MAG: hypothetical protein EDM75_00470 [Chlorobiota bacterium]GJQ33138.1 MAG: hypothetical protein HBSAPP04_19770 [Ignavibacteriaceae bacterium]
MYFIDLFLFTVPALFSLGVLTATYFAFRNYRKQKGMSETPERDFQLPIDKQKKYLYGAFYNPDSPIPTRKRFIPFFAAVILLQIVGAAGYLLGIVILIWLCTFLTLAVAIFAGIRFMKVIIDDKTALKIK